MEENVSRVPYLKETYEMLRMHIYPNCIKTRTVKSEYSTRTVERTILEGDRVCILNVFIFDKSCNYLTFFYFLHTTTFWETVKIEHGGASRQARTNTKKEFLLQIVVENLVSSPG